MNRWLTIVATLATLAPLPGAAQHADLTVWSTAAGGGALNIAAVSSDEILLPQNICTGGQCLYSSPDPGFNLGSSDRPADSLYTLASGTVVTLAIVRIDTGLSIKLGDTTLRNAGQSQRLGSAPGLHVHPSWQLILPTGQRGDYQLEFRLDGGSRYAASPVYTLTFTNEAAPPSASPSSTTAATATLTPAPPASATATELLDTPTATPSSTASPSASATPKASACLGDCSGDGSVTVDELVIGINVALGTLALSECLPFDGNGDTLVTVDEIVRAVQHGLDGCSDVSFAAGR